MSVFWACRQCEAANSPKARVCENCGAERARRNETEAPAGGTGPNVCARCSSSSPSTTEFHQDGTPEDRGVRLCPACWIPALKRRAALDPLRPEERQAWRALVARGEMRFARLRPVVAVSLPNEVRPV
jgi:ribosomal protein L40E